MYSQIKQHQHYKSRAIGNRILQKKQSSLIDNRDKKLIQRVHQRVIQRFDAGTGAGWHIHYGEHVKYDSNNATRVNFGGRTRRQIGYAWEQVIQDHGLAETKTTPDFIACKTWIRDHIA